MTTDDGLTDRQVEVLQYIADGLTFEQMAKKMFLSLSTVKTHKRMAYKKLDAHTAGQAVATGFRRGVIR